MSVVKAWKVPGVKVPPPCERVLKVVVSPEVTGAKDVTILFSIISPGSTTGLHRHDGSEEYMYIVTGRGTFTVGGETTPIEPDVIIIAEAGKDHEIRNLSDETMKLLAIYAPPIKPTGYFEKAVQMAVSRKR